MFAPALYKVTRLTCKSYTDATLQCITHEPVASMIKELVVCDLPPSSNLGDASASVILSAWEASYATMKGEDESKEKEPVCKNASTVHLTDQLMTQLANWRKSKDNEVPPAIKMLIGAMTELAKLQMVCADCSALQYEHGPNGRYKIADTLQAIGQAWTAVTSFASYGSIDVLCQGFVMASSLIIVDYNSVMPSDESFRIYKARSNLSNACWARRGPERGLTPPDRSAKSTIVIRHATQEQYQELCLNLEQNSFHQWSPREFIKPILADPSSDQYKPCHLH
jgi:hypothetical protein